MHRRHFLRKAGLISLGVPLLTAMPALGRGVRSGTLRVLTDRKSQAFSEVTRLMDALDVVNVSVNTSLLPGTHLGDLVLSDAGRVVDYPVEDRWLAELVRTMAHDLALPRPVENPVLLTFRYGTAPSTTGHATIFVDGRPTGMLNLRENNPGVTIQGVGGRLRVRVNGGRVSIVEASCRHRTCMKMGDAELAGDELLCIPARIRIAIDGPSPLGVDVISR